MKGQVNSKVEDTTVYKTLFKSWEDFFGIESLKNDKTMGGYNDCYWDKLNQHIKSVEDIDFANR